MKRLITMILGTWKQIYWIWLKWRYGRVRIIHVGATREEIQMAIDDCVDTGGMIYFPGVINFIWDNNVVE